MFDGDRTISPWKASTPQNWLIQSLRVTGSEVPTSTPYPGTGHFWIDGLMEELGQSYNKCPQPNGWSDLKADWISKEMLDRRLRLSYILGSQLMGLGLGMGQIQTIGKEVFGYAREVAGDDVVGEITAAIPGLSQFI